MTDINVANERLAEIKTRAEAATEGPWVHESTEFREHLGHSVKDSAENVVLFGGYGPRGGTSEANALLAAHARTDVPALLAAVDAVLELHEPVVVQIYAHDQSTSPRKTCAHCLWRDREDALNPADVPSWPCPTVEAVNEALGGDQ